MPEVVAALTRNPILTQSKWADEVTRTGQVSHNVDRKTRNAGAAPTPRSGLVLRTLCPVEPARTAVLLTSVTTGRSCSFIERSFLTNRILSLRPILDLIYCFFDYFRSLLCVSPPASPPEDSATGDLCSGRGKL